MTNPHPISKPQPAVSQTEAYKKAVLANKAVVGIQKNQGTIANLQANNQTLFAQLRQGVNNGTRVLPGYSTQIETIDAILPYVQTMIATGAWGANRITNNQVAITTNAAASNTAPGATISAGDITKLITYVGTLTSQKTSLKAKQTEINKKIDSNNKKITTLQAANASGKPFSSNAKPKPAPGQINPAPPPEFPTPDYLWNLPPHAWSLPVEPSTVSPTTVSHKEDKFHTSRRGRIWFFNGYVGPSNQLDTATGVSKLDPTTGAILGKVQPNKHGFQFMWNPETFSQNTSVNMQVTPSNTDPSSALTAFFAANSTMTFTIRLDRTNDFACASSFRTQYLNSSRIDSVYDKYTNSLDEIVKYYVVGNSDVNGATTKDKINNLLKYGTEADLEYLYKTVNGSGWKGIGGRETSNIGYLMPALIRLDLGNQKFVGVVSSVGVNHLAFTRDLVPIRTDVSITVDLRANVQPVTNTGKVAK
jgi:hypothetical protein